MMYLQLSLSMMRLYTLFFTEYLESKIWRLCIVSGFFGCIAIAGPWGGYLSIFFDKVGIFWFNLNLHFVFILLVCHVDGPPLRTLIGPVSWFITPVTLANSRLGIWILLALCGGGGCHRWVCWRGVYHLTGWRAFAWCGTLLSYCVARCSFER